MPRQKNLTILLGVMLILTACSLPSMPQIPFMPAPATPPPGGTEAPTLAPDVTAGPTAISTSTPEGTIQAYLDLWQAKDYGALYNLFSAESKTKYPLETVETLYIENMAEMTAQRIDITADMDRLQTTPQSALLNFTVTYQTIVLGPIEKEMMLLLVNEAGVWTVVWDPAMILPELVGGNTLDLLADAPERANIYDRNGNWLVMSDAPVATISVNPSLVGDEDEEADMLYDLSSILRMPTSIIQNQYAGQGDTWIAVGDVDPEVVDKYYSFLYNYEAISIADTKFGRRNYYNLAPQVLGYISPLQPDQVDEYVSRGYPIDAYIGQMGLEKSQETILAGQSGGTLTAYTPTGAFYSEIASRESQPALNVYTTLDRDLQIIVQDALADAYFVSQETWQPTANGAAAIVIEVDTGDVLAMASYPYFDANAFNPLNGNPMSSQTYIDGINADRRTPLVNHATQSPQPPGSIFKMITMAATLEEGVFEPDDVLDCQYEWRKPGFGTRYDWNEEGSGPLFLLQALTASCNPWFWEMAIKLDAISPNLLPDYSRQFGLGEETGIEIDEVAGQVPDPEWLLQQPPPDGREWETDDTLNISIGQGNMLVTPIQMVMITGALANGGTLYQPHLVKMVGPTFEEPTTVTEPVARGQIPVSAENLRLIQEAMRNVIIDREIGTAQNRVGGMSIPTAGKTGTAQVSSTGGQPIAWFTGYAPYDEPEIAVIVIVQNGGQGSVIGAPIFRRIIERYYRTSVFHWPDDWLDPELYEEVKEVGE